MFLKICSLFNRLLYFSVGLFAVLNLASTVISINRFWMFWQNITMCQVRWLEKFKCSNAASQLPPLYFILITCRKQFPDWPGSFRVKFVCFVHNLRYFPQGCLAFTNSHTSKFFQWVKLAFRHELKCLLFCQLWDEWNPSDCTQPSAKVSCIWLYRPGLAVFPNTSSQTFEHPIKMIEM